jgi:hypothetical protein
MEGRAKPHVDKYKENTNDWNYDASCSLTSLPVWDLENFKRLIFVAQSVPRYSCCLFSNWLNYHSFEYSFISDILCQFHIFIDLLFVGLLNAVALFDCRARHTLFVLLLQTNVSGCWLHVFGL